MRSKWISTTWGELADLRYGKALKSGERRPGLVRVYGTNGQVDWHDECLANGPGVIIGRKGAYRGVEYSPDDFWVIDTAFWLEPKDLSDVDLRWASLQLLDFDINNLDSGSALPSTSREAFNAIPVLLPPINYQRMVAAAYSAFDDLIENNRRRIEILEEMARLLYREWFVHFRFPGHEDVEMVDSELGPIPEGWEVRKLRDLLTLSYGKALKAADRQGGAVEVYGSGGVVGMHDYALVAGPGVVVGRKGNVGALYWSDVDFYPIDTTYYVETNLPLYYVYQFLGTLTFIDSHAAVPGLSRDQAYGLDVMEAPQSLCEEYEATALPIVHLRQNLTKQNSVLREARDLLLPRLVSGELDVSGLSLEEVLA